jgi:hypothetical protein
VDHGKQFKPQFMQVLKQLESKELRFHVYTEGTEEGRYAEKSYGVTSFPTVIVVIGGDRLYYNGSRTATALKEFILNKKSEGR